LPFNSLTELRAKLYGEFPHLARIDHFAAVGGADLAPLAKASVGSSGATFASPVREYYLTNPIARASAVMGECAQLAAGLQQQAAE
jgi:NADH-quinone oxidoreductase subunit G